ncbi:MAG: glycosyltransferase, partial [Candidatus Fonsibacter sp.]
NATDPIELVHNLGDKIKLIYTSTPWRGLSILIRAVEILNKTRDDFKLDVYSSTKIYGDKFHEREEENFKELFEKCKNTPNINYFGYASNEDVRNALSNSHIYAYPSIF